jgi:hypothetical protein
MSIFAAGIVAQGQNLGICSLCMDDIVPGQVAAFCKVQHVFHKICVEGWLERNTSCLNCHGDATPKGMPVFSTLSSEASLPPDPEKKVESFPEVQAAQQTPSVSQAAKNLKKMQAFGQQR